VVDFLDQALGTFERVADVGLRGYEAYSNLQFNVDSRDFARELQQLQLRNQVATPQVPDPGAYAPQPTYAANQIGGGVAGVSPTLLLLFGGALALVLIARR